jgi:flavin reductase (DIM6/NTAB) family NADH-FMN oxidoreductase RutF
MDINALFSLSYGLYVLSAASNGKDNGCIIKTACQVTNVPNLICVAVNKNNLTCRLITENGHFTINTLTEDTDIKFIGRFGFCSGNDIEKFAGLDIVSDAYGVPMLLDSREVNAVICCQVFGSADAGS